MRMGPHGTGMCVNLSVCAGKCPQAAGNLVIGDADCAGEIERCQIAKVTSAKGITANIGELLVNGTNRGGMLHDRHDPVASFASKVVKNAFICTGAGCRA